MNGRSDEDALPVDLLALSAWLESRGLGRGPIEDPVRLAGGTQNILLRFMHRGRSLVLRRPALHPRPGASETMRREARVLAALACTPVPHPRLVACCEEEAPLGTAFYIMDTVDGFNPAQGLPVSHHDEHVQREMGLSLVDAIAKLGQVDHRAVGLSDLGRPEGFLSRQVVRWARQLESYAEFAGWPGPDGLPHVAQIGIWLDRHRPDRFDPGILHGDFHLANVLFRHDAPDVAAIVDWELATVGDPMLDLGGLLASWPGEDNPLPGMQAIQPWVGFPTADALIERYRAASTRDVSAVDWYTVLACYKLAILLEGTHARACAGLAERSTGELLHRGAVGLMERAARMIA